VTHIGREQRQHHLDVEALSIPLEQLRRGKSMAIMRYWYGPISFCVNRYWHSRAMSC